MLRDPLNKKTNRFRFKPKRTDRLDRGFSNAYMNPISTFRGKPAFKSSKYVTPQFSRGSRRRSINTGGYTLGRKSQNIFQQRSYGGLVSIALVAIVIAIGLFAGWRISQLPNAIGVSETAARSAAARASSFDAMAGGYMQSAYAQVAGGDSSRIVTPTPTVPVEGDDAQEDPLLVIVNASRPLEDGYYVERSTIEYDVWMSSQCAQSAMTMLANMEQAGLSPKVVSAYRSYDTQNALFEAQGSNRMLVEAPNESEHQTGLALDIVASSISMDAGLSDDVSIQVAATPEQQWLFTHAHEYGFILRYPADKADVTGVAFEPWHFRYVGRDAALEIVSSGLALEEYAI